MTVGFPLGFTGHAGQSPRLWQLESRDTVLTTLRKNIGKISL